MIDRHNNACNKNVRIGSYLKQYLADGKIDQMKIYNNYVLRQNTAVFLEFGGLVLKGQVQPFPCEPNEEKKHARMVHVSVRILVLG